MARNQIQIDELIRLEEARLIEGIGNQEAQRTVQRDREQLINDAIDRMRETLVTAYPNTPIDELNRQLNDTRHALREKSGLELQKQGNSRNSKKLTVLIVIIFLFFCFRLFLFTNIISIR